MITSLGTCRLLMPLSESTIASGGPSARPCWTAALMASPSGSDSTAESSAPRPSFGEMSAAFSCSPYCSNSVGKNACTAWPKMIGSETFIIVALRCTDSSTSVGLGPRDLLGEEPAQRGDVHEGGVDDLAGQHLHLVLEHRDGAVGGLVLDAQRVVVGHHDRLLVRAEVVLTHGGHVGLGVRAPGAHPVRVRLGVGLHRRRRAAVGVALAEHRVDGGPLHLVVAGADVALLVGVGALGVVGEVEALLAQLLDRRLELRGRRRDVRQLDDVGLGLGGELAELGEVVGHPLLLAQPVRELAEDAAGQRDVAGLDVDARLGGVGLDDREERVRRQQRRLVGVRVDDRAGLVAHARSWEVRHFSTSR